MRVGFIGAGKVGRTMGLYLRDRSRLQGYYSRTMASSETAAALTDSAAYPSADRLLQDCQLIFITTPDDCIGTVARSLTEHSAAWSNLTFIHMSGAASSELLQPLARKGATICSLHPMLSFGDMDSTLEILPRIMFTIEGQGENMSRVKSFITGLGNSWVEIQSQDKPIYHAAACMVSNYMVTLMDIGVQMLSSIGFDQQQTVDLLGPLVQSTVFGLIRNGPEHALTGPIVRGDTGTVSSHVQAISQCTDQWQHVYSVLGLETVRLAERSGRINSEHAKEMKEVLMDDGKTHNNGHVR